MTAARHDRPERERRDELDRKVLAELSRPEQAAAISRKLGASTAAVVASLTRLAERGQVVQVGGPAPAAPGEPTGTRYAVVPAGMEARDVTRLHDRPE